MNKNKGFIGIGLIIAIVLGVAVVGGGAYYLGKSSKVENKEVVENNSHEVPAGPYGDETNYVAPKPLNNNQTNSTSSITVLSPNGGENLVSGKTYDITWKSASSSDVSIWLSKKGASDVADLITGGSLVSASTGKYSWTIPTSNNDINSGGQFKIVISNKDGNIRDESDNYFTINSASTTLSLQTYTNKKYGIEFKYPATANIIEKQLGRTDLTEGTIITVGLPFKTHYDAWTSKGLNISIYKNSCSDYLPTSLSQKKTINGIDYLFEDPEWTATSGMSTISKWRKYFHESSGICYIIDERISGLGNNERPSTYTVPPNVDKFLSEELIDLDKIMASVKLF